MAETPLGCGAKRTGLVLSGPEALDLEVLNSIFGLHTVLEYSACRMDKVMDGHWARRGRVPLLGLGAQHNTGALLVRVLVVAITSRRASE